MQETAAFLKVCCVLLFVVGTGSTAFAQNIAVPSTPTDITPPAGHTAYLAGHAIGTQGYVCLPTGTGASWTVNGSRPEATLFVTVIGQELQVVTHFTSPNTNPNDNAPKPLPFGSPTWQSSLDSSVVWARALSPSLPAGSDASCPNTGAIPCLLLQTVGSKKGPSGGRMMTRTTYIQRLNTSGGTAPAIGCSVSTDVGKQILVPYTADYYFFRAE
jgi:hypothetical protein